MKYITSCPACETQFLLSTEHLKAYRGKVQCGHCKHIFNAKNRLTEVYENIQGTAQYNTSVNVGKQTSNPIIDDKPINEVLDDVLGAVPNLEDLTANSLVSSDTSDPFIGEQTHIDIEENYTSEAETPIVIEDLTNDPQFQQKKFKLNIGLLSLCLLLITLIFLQTTYHLRSKIASEYPQFKPYLLHACVYLQCTVDLPKNLELFTIDDSDMQESETVQNVINFSSTLINNANYTQTYPNIELALTDTNDQPVLRRQIKPVEYLVPSTSIVAGIAGKTELRIKLAIIVAEANVAGYRVQLTY